MQKEAKIDPGKEISKMVKKDVQKMLDKAWIIINRSKEHPEDVGTGLQFMAFFPVWGQALEGLGEAIENNIKKI